MDLFTFAITQAMFYGASHYNFTDAPTVNRTALSTDAWWGPAGEKANQDKSIRPANITFDANMIADLKDRLNDTRDWIPPMDGVAFQYGFNPAQINNWTKYWRESYNFTAREALFNKYPMYRTNIQGLDMFFLRITPNVTSGVEIVPMLLLHGWPGSIREFFDVIPLLTAVSSDRDFAIELIVPCLPGFGFSKAAVRPGLGAAQMAVVMRNLMNRLGFTKYYIQGGDFGALINGHLATLFPDEVLGYHTNWGVVLSPVAIMLQIVGAMYPPMVVAESELSRMYPITTIFSNLMTATGYMHIQATKPDTIGIALTDSPAALIAYIFEKYATANNKTNGVLPDGGLWTGYDPNFLIDTMMYYWSTHSIQTAMRLYSETFNKYHFGLRMEEIPCHVPTWVVQPSQEFTFQSRLVLSLKYKNILNAEVLTVGGHFLAEGQPVVFTNSVFKALTAFRQFHANSTTTTS